MGNINGASLVELACGLSAHSVQRLACCHQCGCGDIVAPVMVLLVAVIVITSLLPHCSESLSIMRALAVGTMREESAGGFPGGSDGKESRTYTGIVFLLSGPEGHTCHCFVPSLSPL